MLNNATVDADGVRDHAASDEYEPMEMENEEEEQQERQNGMLLFIRIGVLGLLVNCQPSEPFLSKYLLEDKGLEEHDLNKVWAANNWSYLVLIIPCGLLAYRYSYRLVILLGLLARQVTRILLLYGTSLGAMVSMQVSYAVVMSSNVVYFTYVLLFCSKSQYAKGSSIVFLFHHIGNVVGSLLGQVLYDYLDVSLTVLFYLSWLFASLGFVWFLTFFPRDEPTTTRLGKSDLKSIVNIYRSLTREGWIWSVAYMLMQGGTLIWYNYYQMIFYQDNPDTEFGLLEMGVELVSCVGALLPALLVFMSNQHFATPIIFAVVMVVCDVCLAMFVGIYVVGLLRMLVFAAFEVVSQASIAKNTGGQQQDVASKLSFALLFTSFTFVGVLLVSIISAIGVAMSWTATTLLLVVSISNSFILFGVLIMLSCRSRFSN